MQKTKIEWVKNPDGSQGYSWNPVFGICPGGCWYCYGLDYYRRFHSGLNGFYVRQFQLDKLNKRKNPKGIFVCSTFELFHPNLQTHERDAIFKKIEENPQHRFYILTKFPQNIDREMPDNVWLGVTVTQTQDTHIPLSRLVALENAKAKIKFISYEPILEAVYFLPAFYDWLIIGRLTGYGKKYDPTKEWLQTIRNRMRIEEVPLFMKDNLKEIWGDELIQEMPEER